MLISSYSDQIKELMLGSQKVLIATKKNPDLDLLTAAWVLERNLKKQGKQTTLLVENFEPGSLPIFFDGLNIQTALPPKSLIVSVNLQGNLIDKINYQTVDGRLDLIITPKEGNISAEAIEFKQSDLDYDLILVLGAQKLEEIGNIALEHQEALNQISLVNIDNNPANSLFGKLNLVDQTNFTLGQTVFALVKSLGYNLDSLDATALYFALVDKTKQFSQNVSVAVFKMAAELLELGAKTESLDLPKENIIKEEVEMR